ncbi:hypothetical protein F8O01_07270 [Pseudoclavibacter chungangensis]|uniref:Uncharacterized protein n=2 Tax=Pseudoclavibacter chungangensis TaxID=587635 RepID=A0A7J5BW30_9MICO|nr:hypothetical protein F8O01_07270 [Pseudoclavibacter chungangensis]
MPAAGPWGQVPWGAAPQGGWPEQAQAQAQGQWGPPGATGQWTPQPNAAPGGWNGQAQQPVGQSGWSGPGNDPGQPSQQWGPNGPGQWMQPPWGGPPQWVPFQTTPATGGPQAAPGGPAWGQGAAPSHPSPGEAPPVENPHIGYDGVPGGTSGDGPAGRIASSGRPPGAETSPVASATPSIAEAQAVGQADPTSSADSTEGSDDEIVAAPCPSSGDGSGARGEPDSAPASRSTPPGEPRASARVSPVDGERGDRAFPVEAGQPRTRAEARRKASRYGAEPHRFTTTTGSGPRIELSRYAEAALAQTGAMATVPPAPHTGAGEPMPSADGVARDASDRTADDAQGGPIADRLVGGPGEGAPVRALRAVEMPPEDAPFSAASVDTGPVALTGDVASDVRVEVEPHAGSGASGLSLSNRFTPLQFDPVARLLVPALVGAVQYAAQTLGVEHHDDLVGRRGPVAQRQAQDEFARHAVASVRGDVDGLHVGRARDFVRAFDECIARPHGPAVTEVSSDDDRVVGHAAGGDALVASVRDATSDALEEIAEDVVVQRFGRVAHAG